MKMDSLKKVMIPILCLQLGTAPTIYGHGPSNTYVVTGMVLGLLSGGLTAQSFFNCSDTSEEKEKAKEEIALYMKRNHMSLVRDIALARGPIITGWAGELELNSFEQALFENRLEGSKEQLELLAALSGEIDLNDAELFSRSLVSVLVDIVDEERLANLASTSF